MNQFDFVRNWRRTVAPHLQKAAVVRALTLGMRLYDSTYMPGDPPWLLGRGLLNGQRAKKGSLSWYQPWGRCHYIAPFCYAIGKAIHPDLKWVSSRVTPTRSQLATTINGSSRSV